MARILIVEDMALIAFGIQDMLEELGHKVVGIAGTVTTAIESVDALAPPPDAVLLDANLRGDSAKPVAEHLRDIDVPFLIASGYGEEALGRVGRNEPHLHKPFTKEQLNCSLNKLLAD